MTEVRDATIQLPVNQILEIAAFTLAARIFTAGGLTELLVMQHLRTHLKRPEVREFLVWHIKIQSSKDSWSASYLRRGYVDVIENFQSIRPRTQRI